MTPLDVLYRTKPSQQHEPTKKMQVLCLGLSRSGTESLRQALKQLGYDEVYHAYHLFSAKKEDVMQWTKMNEARARHGVHPSRKDFDLLLGHCEAITDVPCNGFAAELIRAYPDAKVIINRRKDADAWYKSIMATVGQMEESWAFWTLSFFEVELYWARRMITVYWTEWCRGDFRGNIREKAVQHYAELDELVEASQIDCLRWSVEDGWGSLCRFLDKPVPEAAFPRGNDPGGYAAEAERTLGKAFARAAQRAAFTLGSVIIVGAGLAYRSWGSSFRK